MITLQWGDLTLSVDPGRICTFDGFDWSMGYKTNDKAVKQKKPKAAAKAPDREQVSLTVRLNAELGVYVPEEIDAWREACNAGTANELYIGNDRFGDHTWRIKTLKVSDAQWNGYAQMLAATLNIAFDENPTYPKTKKKKKKSKKNNNTSPSVPSSGGNSSSNTPITEKYRKNRK